MEILIATLIWIVIGSAVIANFWSIGCGIHLLRRTYTHYEPNQPARRILAWNLIEPGITIPNIVVWYALESEHLVGDNFEWLWVVLRLWPMILLFMILSLFAHRSADPTVWWAARKTAKLGIIRLLIITIFGIGIVCVPILFWSLKKIRLWNEELLGQSAGSWATAAIVGGKSGMLVMPTDQITSESGFKVLMD